MAAPAATFVALQPSSSSALFHFCPFGVLNRIGSPVAAFGILNMNRTCQVRRPLSTSASSRPPPSEPSSGKDPNFFTDARLGGHNQILLLEISMSIILLAETGTIVTSLWWYVKQSCRHGYELEKNILKYSYRLDLKRTIFTKLKITNCLQTMLSRAEDSLRIFFAVLFWMSLFFWGSAWEGRDGDKKKKGLRKRK